jgi:hypothetical protein
MLKAARAQGMPMMVIAMTTAATPHPTAIHTQPNTSHNRLSNNSIGVIALELEHCDQQRQSELRTAEIDEPTEQPRRRQATSPAGGG